MIQRYAAYKGLTLALDTHRIKVKGWKKMFQVNVNNNNKSRGGLLLLISDKIDFKQKKGKKTKS